MKLNVYYFDLFKCVIAIICSSFLFIVLYYLFFPTIAFAAGPPIEEVTDYYGNVEYVGRDPYGYYHNPRPQQHTSCNPLGTANNRAELEGSHCYNTRSEQYKAYRPLGTTNNRAELDGLTCEGSLGVRIGYLAPPVHELNAMSMEGTVSTEIFDRDLFNSRFEAMKERIINYNLNENKSFFKNIVVGFQSVNDNITALYIKATDVTKRKVYWTVWAKGRGKYDSYEEFKRTWDSSIGFWSRLEKSVKSDVQRDIKDILGVNEIKRQVKKSVKKEVEKALKRNNPFRR